MLTKIKTIFMIVFFAVLSVAIVVAGSVIGLILSALVPVFTVFTGLWVLWFIWRDHTTAPNDSGS